MARKGTLVASTPIEKALVEALEAQAGARGIDIVDVEVVGTGKAQVVRVRIDHADESLPTISLDEVSEQTAWISDVVDALDPIAESYSLEVSSPGLARPLRRAHDFERFAGERVSLTTTATEGRRKFTGELCGLVDGAVVLACDDGEFRFAVEDIRTCTIKPDYDAIAKGAAQKKEG